MNNCADKSTVYDRKRLTIKCVLALGLIFLSGCVVQQPNHPGDGFYAPVLQVIPEPEPAVNGSLYRGTSSINLFSDNKATQVGDILTVMLQERTSSSKSSNIGVVKDNDIGISNGGDSTGTLLGLKPTVGNLGLNTGLVAARDFKGEAEADQSNRLSGSISVTVVAVYPNGTLAIRGEKWMTLNRGDEFIRVSGLVRDSDISPDNTVLSTKIANAHITYAGEGELADSQQMGWLSRFFNSAVWPF